jgi:HlyD family secretion protein
MRIKSNFILSFCFIIVFFSCRNKTNNNQYQIKRGEFLASLTETGELQAVRSRQIIMPFIGWKYGWSFKITWLADHGAKVVADDSVAQIDQAAVTKFLYEEKNKLEVEQANLSKIQVSNNTKLVALNSELLSEQANYDLIKLQVDKYKFEPENKRKVKDLELQKAQVNLDRVKKKQELLKVVLKNEMHIQEIKISQIENNIADAEAAYRKLKINSPIKGIVQLNANRRTNQTMRVGDEVWQGSELAKVPDLSEMKVLATVNEEDIGKIALGQKVIVRLDAFPDKEFIGKINYIGKLSYPKTQNSLVKIFDVEILMVKNDPSLKPGMTVSCEIVFSTFKDIFYVENECIHKDSIGNCYVVPEKEKNKKINIKAGPSNNKFTVVYGHVTEGLKLEPAYKIENEENKN